MSILYLALLSLGCLTADAVLVAPSVAGQSAAKRRVEWEVVFPEVITAEEYARQMDYFKIEIAAVSKNGKVEYVSKVAERKPEKRVGNGAVDYRLYIGWRSGTLHAIDRKLLRKVGISSDNKELRHYFPVETQNQMERVERAHARRDPGELKRTRFEIRAAKKPGTYEFVVIEQDPPPAEGDPRTPVESQNSPTTN